MKVQEWQRKWLQNPWQRLRNAQHFSQVNRLVFGGSISQKHRLLWKKWRSGKQHLRICAFLCPLKHWNATEEKRNVSDGMAFPWIKRHKVIVVFPILQRKGNILYQNILLHTDATCLAKLAWQTILHPPFWQNKHAEILTMFSIAPQWNLAQIKLQERFYWGATFYIAATLRQPSRCPHFNLFHHILTISSLQYLISRK